MVGTEGDSVDRALDDIAGGTRQERIAAALALRSSERPEVDAALLGLFEAAGTDVELRTIAARVLAERDPDRDPTFLVRWLLGPLADVELICAGGVDSRLATYALVGGKDGGTRLRRLRPVRRHAAALTSGRFRGLRAAAAIGLGDTADLAALDPLCAALADRSSAVRLEAADAVRRLRHAGAADVLADHPIRHALVGCLSDRRRAVRIAAAQALAVNGQLDAVRAHRERANRKDRHELDRILAGDIPPLGKIWVGDDTT